MAAPLTLPLDRTARRAIARRYATRFQQYYAVGKLGGDPAFAEVARRLARVPALPLLDLGCGTGLLGQYLAGCGLLHGYLGIDLDARRIALGSHAGAALPAPFTLQCADASRPPPFRGHVAMLDVLHYLPAPTQAALLRAATDRLAPGGLLLIRNALRTRHWRYTATRLEEVLLHGMRLIRTRVHHYPRAEEIIAPLRAGGLEVEVMPLFGRTPFNSHLVVARHPG